MAENPFEIVSKIGNYALPAFSAFLAASVALGKFSWSEDRGRYFLLALSLYTIIAVFISYIHRLCWLRHRNKLINEGNKPEDLPFYGVVIFLLIHGLLIIGLVLIVYNYSWL